MSDSDSELAPRAMEDEGAPAVPSETIAEANLAAPRPATSVAAPATPDVTSHDVAQEDPEEAEEMVCIKGTRDGAGERLRFDRKKVLLAYAGVALPAGLDPLPAFGLGAASPYGPYYYAYVKGGEAVAFRKACDGKLMINGPDDELYGLEVSALCTNNVNKESSGVRATRDLRSP